MCLKDFEKKTLFKCLNCGYSFYKDEKSEVYECRDCKCTAIPMETYEQINQGAPNMSEFNKPEIILPENSNTTLEAITKSETDIQVSTAKKYPRDIAAFKKDAISLATSDKDIAETCFYKLTRKTNAGGIKNIEGPSTRLAEIIAHAWKNLRYGSRIIEIGEKEVTAQGFAWDMEKNTGTTSEVKRSIFSKTGGRYSEDMILVTCNAACLIAFRNAIFKTIPFTYVKPIYDAAKKAAMGNFNNAQSFKERVNDCIQKFSAIGISESQLLKYINRQKITDIKFTDLEDLIGILSSIKEGEISVSDFHDNESKVERLSPEAVTAVCTKVKVLKIPDLNVSQILHSMHYTYIKEVHTSDYGTLLKRLDDEADLIKSAAAADKGNR